mgnify:CR=1 FL=1
MKSFQKLKEYRVTNAVKTVSRTEKEHFPGDGFKVALLDLGTKIILSVLYKNVDVTLQFILQIQQRKKS